MCVPNVTAQMLWKFFYTSVNNFTQYFLVALNFLNRVDQKGRKRKASSDNSCILDEKIYISMLFFLPSRVKGAFHVKGPYVK